MLSDIRDSLVKQGEMFATKSDLNGLQNEFSMLRDEMNRVRGAYMGISITLGVVLTLVTIIVNAFHL